jgi:hypothetical protein
VRRHRDGGKNVEFAGFKTYSWTKGQPAFDKTIDAQLSPPVDRELNALGDQKATSGPGDVLAAYYSLSPHGCDVKAKPDPQGAAADCRNADGRLLDPVAAAVAVAGGRPIGSQLEPTINAAVADVRLYRHATE